MATSDTDLYTQSGAEPASPNSTSRISVPGNRGVKVTRAVTVRKPAAELYSFWSNPENLMRVVKHPVLIVAKSPKESHWSVTPPAGGDSIEWDSKIIQDEENRVIAWRSLEGAEVANAGSVRFEEAPGGLGTEVKVTLEYDPPGGKFAAWVAKLSSHDPGRQVADTLRRFKALFEAGEIPTIQGQSVGEPQRSKNKEKKS